MKRKFVVMIAVVAFIFGMISSGAYFHYGNSSQSSMVAENTTQKAAWYNTGNRGFD